MSGTLLRTPRSISTLLLRRGPCGLSLQSRRHFSHSSHWDAFKTCFPELKARGLVESVTGPEGTIEKRVAEKPIVVYSGVDATAASLHIGHLLPLMNMLHFYLNGNHTISIVGKATASVGDPSGRTRERDELRQQKLEIQFKGIWNQLERFYENGKIYALKRGYKEENIGTREVITNSDWLDNMGIVEFLSTIGRHVNVRHMLARDSVRGRMATVSGINFAEFTYQLLQSYDFWHLYNTKGCELQIGGNDQYGNITAGVDLINRLYKIHNPVKPEENPEEPEEKSEDNPEKEPPRAFGLTVPLLTTAKGEKIGKSAGNAIWLDAHLTSPFDLYQYFIRLPDAVVPEYLSKFTLLPLTKIEELISKHQEAPHERVAHRALASEIVELIHGIEALEKAEERTKTLFSTVDSKLLSMTGQELVEAFGEKIIKLPWDAIMGNTITHALKTLNIAPSAAAARKMVRSGGVYMGREGEKIIDPSQKIKKLWLLDGNVLLMRVGKKNYNVVQLE